LGNLYFNDGRLQQAELQFQASVASIPNAGAVDSLADIALGQGRADVAERDYRQGIALDEFDPRGHFGLATILEAQGHESEALTEYRAGLNVDPLNQEAQAALKRLTGKLHDAKAPRQ